MSEAKWEELRQQHQAWLERPHTSQGQRDDSATIVALLDELDRLSWSGVHTCHSGCKRTVCVLRRERNDALKELDALKRNQGKDIALTEARRERDEAVKERDAAQAAEYQRDQARRDYGTAEIERSRLSSALAQRTAERDALHAQVEGPDGLNSLRHRVSLYFTMLERSEKELKDARRLLAEAEGALRWIELDTRDPTAPNERSNKRAREALAKIAEVRGGRKMEDE